MLCRYGLRIHPGDRSLFFCVMGVHNIFVLISISVFNRRVSNYDIFIIPIQRYLKEMSQK